jgi:hypothetical protein
VGTNDHPPPPAVSSASPSRSRRVGRSPN